mmetsp:Transcript_29845/g.42383  ORF Transcript_29845/g.42383 Transcript_29845/m.42383 type:complete len:203 (-) Transcript_29845:163-771(-)
MKLLTLDLILVSFVLALTGFVNGVEERIVTADGETQVTNTGDDGSDKSKEDGAEEKKEDFRATARIITLEELAEYDGKEEGKPIWLSILGEVYDVSKGPEHYGAKRGYNIFAGRDGSVPYITGKFTPEEASKSLSVLKSGECHSLEQWRQFYYDEKKYPFQGLSLGRFYDENRNPTEELIEFHQCVKDYKPPERRKRKPPKK